MLKHFKYIKFNATSRLPVILQTEVAECGLASLAMVANYYQSKVDLSSLRQKFSVSTKGMTLHGLIILADKMQFCSRPLRLDLDVLSMLKTPAILHWDLNHFVVLKSVKGNCITIHDPAIGKRKFTREEFSSHFTGIALELTPASNFKPIKKVPKVSLSDFWGQISGLKRTIAQVLVLSFLLQAFTIATPFYMQIVVDDVIMTQDIHLLIILSLGFGVLNIFSIIVMSLRETLILYMGSQLNLQIAANLFRHLLRLPLNYFEKRHTGDIQSRFASLEKIKQLFTTGLVETIVDGLMAIGLLIMMFVYSPKLTIVVLISITLYILFRVISFKPYKLSNEELIVTGAKQSSHFIESIRAIQGIKLFGNETQRGSNWQNLYAENINASIKVGKLSIKYEFINNLIFGVENIIIIYLAASEVITNKMSVGMLFAFITYKTQFTARNSALVNQFIQFKMLSLHLERLGDIVLSKQERNLNGVGLATELEGKLVLENICFRYSDSEPYILKNLNLVIEKGSSVAIVGSSGCGKTTLMKIMLGLIQPESGSVFVDGNDIRQTGLNYYRQMIGTVMQDDMLLSGSIADNICFFEVGYNNERVIECAMLASIHDEIIEMPMGYNTLIVDMGGNLSGGQIQRMLLARAIYKNPKILFLDEATSSLDVALEKKVNETIEKLDITRVFIAHRPETIAMADRVLSLNNGKF